MIISGFAGIYTDAVMTRSDTRQLKGLAILMMLWLHLFSNEETVRQCCYLLTYVNGQPLAYSLTRLASACVPIYIFLGGYGLAATYQATAGHKLYGGRRALALMVNFWVVFLIFVPIGCLLNPARYPGDGLTLLLNAMAICYSYNGAWWFLLPYVLLTLSAQLIIRSIMESSKRLNMLWLGGMAVISMVIYVLKSEKTITAIWPVPGVMTLLNFLSMLFLFGMGVVAVKYQWANSLWNRLKSRPQWELVLWLVVLCVVKMMLGASSLLNVPFILLLIPLLLAIHWPRWVHGALEFLGYHSTNMWLIHHFYYFIFGSLIYELCYPLLIFLCLVLVSLGCSMLLQPLIEPIRRKIRRM